MIDIIIEEIQGIVNVKKKIIQFIYQNKNINIKKYTTPSFMLTQSSDVQ